MKQWGFKWGHSVGAVSRVCKWGLHDFYEQKSFSISALVLVGNRFSIVSGKAVLHSVR